MHSCTAAPHTLCTPTAQNLATPQALFPAPALPSPNAQDLQPCSLPQPLSAPHGTAAVLHCRVLGALQGAR